MVLQSQSLGISLDNPEVIRAYFNKIRSLAKSGDKYPVQLDEVWPLVYSEKSKAVRALRQHFFEDTDYQSLAQIGKREIGASVTHVYSLTVSCLEYFIARKIRAIFDIYREVFHRVADMAERAVDNTGLMVSAMAELVGQLTSEVRTLAQKLESVEQKQEEYIEAKIAREQPYTVPINDDARDKRDEWRRGFLRLFDKYVRYSFGETPESLTNQIYVKMRELYRVDISLLQVFKGEHWLDVCYRNNFHKQVYETLAYQLPNSKHLS